MADVITDADVVLRHRTALRRYAFSRPVAIALRDGLITESSSVFDYGCGRGDDVSRLLDRGIQARGWDPVFLPSEDLILSDVVNLGFVVNVIEDPEERKMAIRGAWSLARRLLIIAARNVWEAREVEGLEHSDGLLTRRMTFQKFFAQEELREWIDSTLGVESVAAAPGVFYAFRDSELRESFMASRYRRSATAPRVRMTDILFEQHRVLLEQLMGFIASRGRLPRADEELSPPVVKALGSVRRAFQIIRRVTGPERWEEITLERQQDLLVYLALARFPRRPRLSDLPKDLQYDVRDFFGTYSSACTKADDLLFSVGKRELIDVACRSSPVGKLTPSALYVHASALDALPALMRAFEGCARALVGVVEGANVIKFHRDGARISYLSYPRFEEDPHPALATVVLVRPGKLLAEFRDYRRSPNPPILHRKETFVTTDHPLREKFARLTTQEERWGLYEEPQRIGTQQAWEGVLGERGFTLRGHRLVRTHGATS